MITALRGKRKMPTSESEEMVSNSWMSASREGEKHCQIKYVCEIVSRFLWRKWHIWTDAENHRWAMHWQGWRRGMRCISGNALSVLQDILCRERCRVAGDENSCSVLEPFGVEHIIRQLSLYLLPHTFGRVCTSYSLMRNQWLILCVCRFGQGYDTKTFMPWI